MKFSIKALHLLLIMVIFPLGNLCAETTVGGAEENLLLKPSRYISRGDYREAASLLVQLLKGEHDEITGKRALYMLAHVQKRMGNLTQALILYKRTSLEYPEMEDYALYNTVEILREMGACGAALKMAETLLVKFPESRLIPKVLLSKVRIQYALERTEEALATARQLIREHPRFEGTPQAKFLRGEILETLDRKEEAWRTYKEIYLQHPDFQEDRRVREKLTALNPDAEVPSPLTPEEMIIRGERLMELNLWDRAAELFEDLLKREMGSSREPDILFRLGNCYEKMKMRKEGARHLQRFLKVAPGHKLEPEVLYMLGRMYWNLNDPLLAREHLLRLVSDSRQGRWSARAHYLLGRISEEEGESRQAEEHYKTLAEAFPSYDEAAQALWRWGRIHYREGRLKEAISTFNRLTQLHPYSPQAEGAAFWAARATAKMGDKEGAAALYRRLIKRFPLSYYALRGRSELADLLEEEEQEGLKDRLAIRLTNDIPPSPFNLNRLRNPAKFHALRVMELSAMGFLADAREELAYLKGGFPGDYESLLARADLHSAAGDNVTSIRLMMGTLHRIMREGGTSGGDASVPMSLMTRLFPLYQGEEIFSYSQENGVDPLLIASLIRQESGFDTLAVSPAGALGLMQIIPSTGGRLYGGGFRQKLLLDPEINISLGTRYLADLIRKFKGDIVLALASYNAGENKVSQWSARIDAEDTEDFIEEISYGETRGYVKNVLRNYYIYKQLYGGSGGEDTPASDLAGQDD